MASTALCGAALLEGCSGSGGTNKAAAADATTSVSQQPQQPPNQPTWKRLRLGAGGYVTGINIARDGTKVVRTDTFGAYIWDEAGTIWRELLTRKTLPAGDVPFPAYTGDQSGGGKSDGPGCWEVGVATNDSSIIYAVWNAYCYRSADQGKTFTKTALPRINARANDQNFAGGIERVMGPKLAIDPTNPNNVWISGDMGDSLWFTSDGGASWAQTTQVPAANDGTSSQTNLGPCLIAFDPSSPVVGGRTQGIYVASYGNGLFHSRDGGATFQQVPGAPTVFRRLTCDQLGRVWLCDANASGGGIRRYAKGAWSSYGPNNVRLVDVSVDPADPAHIIAWSNTLRLVQSKDDGATWVYWYSHSDPNLSSISVVADDVPWLTKAANAMSIAASAFDPSNGRCYVASGVGVFYTEQYPDARAQSFVIKSQSLGLEQLCVRRVLASPGGSPVTVQLDRSSMKMTDLNAPPSSYGPSLALVDGFDLDYSSSNPAFIVTLCAKGGNFSGYSSDFGATWNYFAGKDQMSPAPGGSIAVGASDNVVHIPGNNGVARYSSDGGRSWLPLAIPGLPKVDGIESGWGWLWAFHRKILCSDKALANVFYAYNYGPKGTPELAGVWRSNDGGRTWQQVKAGPMGQWTTFHAQMDSVPDQGGHLFFTAGLEQGQPLYRSVDGGVTWTTVTGFKNVIAFGFGKTLNQNTYPTIFVSGWLNDVYAIWRSNDNCATWTKIGDYPLDSIDAPCSIAGDPNVVGRCYVAFNGSGAAYFDAST